MGGDIDYVLRAIRIASWNKCQLHLIAQKYSGKTTVDSCGKSIAEPE